MSDFLSAMAAFASLDDETLDRDWQWRGREALVRDALYRSLEDEQNALIAARRAERSEAERILALAQRAFGDLCGVLVARPEELLDASPGEGSWTVRQILKHLTGVERRYAASTLYAAHRRDTDPVVLPESRRPADDDNDVAGGVARIIERFAALRAQSDALLGVLPTESLTRETIWSDHEVDVRFRLHRFASHLIEHTIQCERALDALGAARGEARSIVRRIWSVRGELEGVAENATLSTLDAAHAERASSVRQAQTSPARSLV
jgi:uncharacterized damage-inducible protein DinB